MNKKLTTIILSLGLVLGMATTTQAKVDSYIVNNLNKNYSYNMVKLQESFINETLGVGDTSMLKDFQTKLKDGKILAFKEDTGKYVSFQEVKNAFIDATLAGTEFDLDEYIKSAKGMSIDGVTEDNTKPEDPVTDPKGIIREKRMTDAEVLERLGLPTVYHKADLASKAVEAPKEWVGGNDDYLDTRYLPNDGKIYHNVEADDTGLGWSRVYDAYYCVMDRYYQADGQILYQIAVFSCYKNVEPLLGYYNEREGEMKNVK